MDFLRFCEAFAPLKGKLGSSEIEVDHAMIATAERLLSLFKEGKTTKAVRSISLSMPGYSLPSAPAALAHEGDENLDAMLSMLSRGRTAAIPVPTSHEQHE